MTTVRKDQFGNTLLPQSSSDHPDNLRELVKGLRRSAPYVMDRSGEAASLMFLAAEIVNGAADVADLEPAVAGPARKPAKGGKGKPETGGERIRAARNLPPCVDGGRHKWLKTGWCGKPGCVVHREGKTPEQSQAEIAGVEVTE